MNVLINFGPLKAGGGQNVALNFLLGLRGIDARDINLAFLVAKDSELATAVRDTSFRMVEVPQNPLRRMLWELRQGGRCLKELEIDVVYSYFGYAVMPGRVPQVSGSADSNLYYPEVDFWAGYSRLQRCKKWLVDAYRRYGIRHSDAVVFENPDLEQRGRELFGLKRTRYIKPSIVPVESAEGGSSTDGIRTGYPRAVMLCGWHRNKNVAMIPELAAEMKRRGQPVEFLLTTVYDDSDIAREFEASVEKLQVSDVVSLIGQVPKSHLSSLYRSCDVALLLSKLESFSNTVIEAWMFECPLLVADEPWSRSICGDGAAYSDRESTAGVADTLSALINDGDFRRRLIDGGIQRLSSYPSIEERIQAEFDYLREVVSDA